MGSSIIKGPDNNVAEVDELSSGLVLIDTVHRNIHRGIMFQSDFVNMTLADDASIDMLLRVPATKAAHLRFSAGLGGDGQGFLYEAPTTTDDGTPVARNNRNRFSPNTADILVFHTPTVTVVGTLLLTGIVPGGGGPHAVGSLARSFEEWILAPADYLFRLTNKSTGTQPASIALDWYEPTLL